MVDRGKIAYPGGRSRLKVTLGQLDYEWKHLRAKLAIRDKAWLASLGRVARPDAHPAFRVVTGDVEDWGSRRSTPQNKRMKLAKLPREKTQLTGVR